MTTRDPKIKRAYNSENREAKAALTRRQILSSAKKLFETSSIEDVTIEKIAAEAQVSAPTIYALFQSKRGIVRQIIDEAIPSPQYEALLEEVNQVKTATELLSISAKIAREMYDAERIQMDAFWRASIATSEFKELEKEREIRRYQRQKESLQKIWDEKKLLPELSLPKAQDILWAFTGRDLYRLLVVEKGWSSEEYEKWLTQLLVTTLIGLKSDDV